MDLDPMLFFDREIDSSPLELTNNLFHYTGADAGIFGILGSGSLRLSPFESTNDLWESRPTYPSLQSHADDDGAPTGEGNEVMYLWADIDHQIRRTTKVACLTQDFKVSPTVITPDVMRGWNHLSMWAHYGAGHRGICLQFDKSQLINELESAETDDVHVLHGPVLYRSASISPAAEGLDLGQIREFGVDVAARQYMMKHEKALFLQKHRDWQNENEYRLVRSDRSAMPHLLPISRALTGIYLGESFPEALLPALHEVLQRYSNVEVFKLSFMNRNLFSGPFDVQSDLPRPSHPWIIPRRIGGFAERVNGLLIAEKEREELREEGERDSRKLGEQLDADVLGLLQEMPQIADLKVEALESGSAIPSELRRRSAGVPGEVVHFEKGMLLVMNSTVNPAHYLNISAAFQILNDRRVRLHAVAVLENLTDSPNHQNELWRDSAETTVDLALSEWARVKSKCVV